MTIPTIHLNGTSRANLLEQQLDAAHALRAALEKLSEACPNGRDYYPQGPEAMSAAVREHESRMERVRSVLREVSDLADAIDSAPGQGRAGR